MVWTYMSLNVTTIHRYTDEVVAMQNMMITFVDFVWMSEIIILVVSYIKYILVFDVKIQEGQR